MRKLGKEAARLEMDKNEKKTRPSWSSLPDDSGVTNLRMDGPT